MTSPYNKQAMDAKNSEYALETTVWQPRRGYPPNWTPAAVERVPSDIANSEYSEKALGDPERYRDRDIDYRSFVSPFLSLTSANHLTRDEADNGEDTEHKGKLRSPITTNDSSTDTSLDFVRTTSSIIQNGLGNEILYLQVLTNGETRVVRKPGVLPVVLYVDSATSTSSEKSATSAVKRSGENFRKLMDGLSIEGKPDFAQVMKC